MTPAHGFLALAIVCEVVATSSLKLTQEFTRPLPSVVVLLGYSASFWLLARALRDLPVGMAYAVWSGCGIVLVAAAGVLLYGQRVDLAGAIGMALILTGVIVLNTVSSMQVH